MPEDKPAIIVKDLYKSFRLPHEQHSGLKQLIVNFFKRKKGYEVQQVLEDVSFEIKKGEFFGIVGRNGSGKSTLLKLLAGIYAPDKGLVQLNGSLTPFIELGVGFNPELTGRENVYMNGALLGFGHEEMDQMYDEIVDFAELRRFMDQKLKNYSSGMQVRLAFSIAIRAKSDILLIDEVLAVGDEAFQRKCFSYFDELKRNKQTVILVTHDMASVERFCDSALLIDKGEIKYTGDPIKIAFEYSKFNQDARQVEIAKLDDARQDKDYQVDLLDQSGKPTNSYNYSEMLRLDISWQNPQVKNIGVALVKQSGEYIFGPNTFQDKFDLQGKTHISYQAMMNLSEGEYSVLIGFFGEDDTENLHFISEGPRFIIKKEKNDNKGVWGGITYLEHSWVVEQPEG